MKKTFDGIVVSTKMKKTVVVSVTRGVPHPLYKKILKRDNKIKADVSSFSPNVGDRVLIEEVKPISKSKHFKVKEIIKNDSK